MARALGKLGLGNRGPCAAREVVALEEHVALAAVVRRLVLQQEPRVIRVRLEHRGTLAVGEGAAPRVGLADADVLGDELPAVAVDHALGSAQLGRLLLADGEVRLVLGEAVVHAVLEGDGGVDHAAACALRLVDPDLRFREGDEVPRGRVHHPLVARRDVTLVCGEVVGVERGRPVHDVLLVRRVPVRLGRPRVARVLGRDDDLALLRPVDEVVGLPHHDRAAAGLLGGAEVASAVDAQVGREQEEAVALRRADEEGIAQPLLAEGRGEHGLAVVEGDPFLGVVADARGEVDLLAVWSGFADEVREEVGGERFVGGRRGHRRDVVVRRGRAVEGRRRLEGDGRGVGPVRRTLDEPVGGDDGRVARGPGDGGAAGSARGKRDVAADVVEVGDGQAGRVARGDVARCGDGGCDDRHCDGGGRREEGERERGAQSDARLPADPSSPVWLFGHRR